MLLKCGDRTLDLARPQVMGVLNVTPDSFFDGGRYGSIAAAVAHAREMVEQGAAVIDVGGESTRPGAAPVSEVDELARVVPVIEAIVREFPVVVSIDTSKPAVMRAAVEAGAGLVNDIYALRHPDAIATVAELSVPVCLMHMQGEPHSMQHSPAYKNVVVEVRDFLQARVAACKAGGIAASNILIDPGFGFGKSLSHNLALMRELAQLVALTYPVLVGVSRKSMIGGVLNVPVEQRLAGSLALASLAVWQGAKIVRAHDVGATVEALRMCYAVMDNTFING